LLSLKTKRFAIAQRPQRLDQRRRGEDPYTSDQQRERDKYSLNETDWYEVTYEEVYGSSYCKLALHQDWMTRKGYQLGAVVNMDLPEQGISGPFKITAIRHILPQKKPVDEDPTDDYDYRPVTGIFVHQSDDVWTLTFDSGEPLGVTYNHPVYSVTAGGWRPAGELEIGERVLTLGGQAVVDLKEKDEGIHIVYNLEVNEFHDFLVGNNGVVVHNTGFCEFLKSYFSQYSRWHKTHPDNWLDDEKIDAFKQAMKDNDPYVFKEPIFTITYEGRTYILDGHHRLKAAKELKAEGYDIEIPHSNIASDHVNTVSPYENIDDLINNSYSPDE
jgi:hypothetical protein